MARKILCGLISRKILIGAICALVAVCLHAPVALGQHGGGAHGSFGGGHYGGGHSGAGYHGGHSGGGWHPSAPHGSKGSGSFGTASAARGSVIIVPPVRLNPNSFLFRPHPPSPLPHPPQPVPIFFVPVFFGTPFSFCGGFNSFGWPACDSFWGPGCNFSPFYRYGYGYWGYGYGGFPYNGYDFGSLGLATGTTVYSSTAGEQTTTTIQSYVSPSYPTDARARDLVQLFFKDGTVVDVTDYWLVDGQLHFLTVDERGEKAVEHVLPFDTLDLQTTVDVNTGRGFRFQLRSESMEQYFRNHPEVVPMVDPNAPRN